MKNRIIFFSGGKASFAVADYVKMKYPNDNILLYFQDVQAENKDLYRFINDVSDRLELPMLIHSMGLSPVQLMFENKMLYSSRIGDCSKILKVRTAKNYLKRGIVPPIEKWRNKHFLKSEDFRNEPVLYFGIGFEEMHRTEAMIKNWQPYQCEFPLIEYYIDTNMALKKHNIEEPELYKLGFSHNNCNGCCVRAGQQHFRHLREVMPDVFAKFVEQEHYLKLCISEYHRINRLEVGEIPNFTEESRQAWLQQLDDCYRDYFYDIAKRPKPYIPMDFYIEQYAFLKSTKNGVTKPLPLSQLSQEGNKNKVIDSSMSLFDNPELDWGGCGCFTEIDNDSDQTEIACQFEKRNIPKITTMTFKKKEKIEEKIEQLTLF